MRLGSACVTVRRTLPSSINSVCPGATAAKISGCGKNARVASPGAGSQSSTKLSPLATIADPPAKVPSRSLGPCRSTRIPIGRPSSFSMPRITATSSRRRSWLV
jgi:hypothetical protein